MSQFEPGAAFYVARGIKFTEDHPSGLTMGYFWAYSWILIPIAGIAAGAWKEWLKFKAEQSNLGDSTKELEREVKQLTQQLNSEKAALTQRIQNLEAIVTSVDWDSQLALPATEPLLTIEPEEPSDAEQIARLAKKVR